jgi:hypothetical protein
MVRGWRLAIAGAVFLVLAAGAFQPFYWRVFSLNRAPMRAYRTELPYRQLPGFYRFFLTVRAQTNDGDRVALVVPRPLTPSYEFIFERASYLLYGRTVVPMREATSADLIAAYGVDLSVPDYAKVWKSRDGVFLRRDSVPRRRHTEPGNAMTSLLFAFAVGVPAARLVDREAPLLRLIGEAMLLGIAVCAATLFAMSCVGIGWSLLWAVTFLVIAGIALVVIATKDVSWAIRLERLHPLDLATLATLVGFTLFATAGPSPENDFIAIWGLKAATFSLHGGIDWAFLQNPWYVWDHPDYPLLLPLSFDFMSLFSGGWQHAAVEWLNPYFAAAIIAIVRSLLAEEASPLFASLGTLAIAPLAMTPWIGLAEAPLIAFGTAGILLARRHNMTAAALFLGCAAVTKNEGMALVVAVAIALLLTRRSRDVWRLWPAVAIAMPWLIARAIFSLPTDIASGPVVARALARLRAPGELVNVLLSHTAPQAVFWIAIALALVVTVRLLRDEAFALATAFVQLAFYIGSYVVTARDVTWHVHWSWERLMTHVELLLAFVSVVLLVRWTRRGSQESHT